MKATYMFHHFPMSVAAQNVSQPQINTVPIYSCAVESFLTSCIAVWYGNTTVISRKRLQREVKTAEEITICNDRVQSDIYSTCTDGTCTHYLHLIADNNVVTLMLPVFVLLIIYLYLHLFIVNVWLMLWTAEKEFYRTGKCVS